MILSKNVDQAARIRGICPRIFGVTGVAARLVGRLHAVHLFHVAWLCTMQNVTTAWSFPRLRVGAVTCQLFLLHGCLLCSNPMLEAGWFASSPWLHPVGRGTVDGQSFVRSVHWSHARALRRRIAASAAVQSGFGSLHAMAALEQFHCSGACVAGHGSPPPTVSL